MKRLLILLMVCAGILLIHAQEERAIHVFQKDGTITTFLWADVDSIGYYDGSERQMGKPEIQQIFLKNSKHCTLLEDIDSVVFTPPSYFVWVQTRTTIDEKHLSAKLRGLLGGREPSDKVFTCGFEVFDENQTHLIAKYDCGQLKLGETFTKTVTHQDDHYVCGRRYSYRAYVIGDNGKKCYGGFETLKLNPVIVGTYAYPHIEEDDLYNDYYMAEVEANIFGSTEEVEVYGKTGFYYGTEYNPTADSPNAIRQEGMLNEVKDIEATLRKLVPSTKYYYQAFVEIGDSIFYGGTESFIIDPAIQVTTFDATDIGVTSAGAEYMVLDAGNWDNFKNGLHGYVGIQFGSTSDLYGLGENSYYRMAEWDQTCTDRYFVSFINLSLKTTYYYRAYADINGKRYYGNIKSFTTNELRVITQDATEVTISSAQLHAQLNFSDAAKEGERFGFYINTSGNPNESNAYEMYGTFKSGDIGKFYGSISGLESNTVYYYRGYVTFNGATYYGEVKTFITEIDERIEIPENILSKIGGYIPIYSGKNPPNVEGTYFVDPHETVYCEDYKPSWTTYYPGYIINSYYFRFSNQDMVYNTVDFADIDVTGDYYDIGNGAFISGSGNNFTAFFNIEGVEQDIRTKRELLISGTKTADGIKDLHYGFVMVEKGYDPKGALMEEGMFRVFKDQDGLSINSDWPSWFSRRVTVKTRNRNQDISKSPFGGGDLNNTSTTETTEQITKPISSGTINGFVRQLNPVKEEIQEDAEGGKNVSQERIGINCIYYLDNSI